MYSIAYYDTIKKYLHCPKYLCQTLAKPSKLRKGVSRHDDVKL